MISTVTTAVTTVVSSSAVSLMASLGGAGVLTLIVSLVLKELVSAGGTGRRSLGSNLNVIILPLLFVFSFIVFMKVWEILC
ncbi:hypothetical protein ACFLWB_02190 [Chloroflexota bacterium]